MVAVLSPFEAGDVVAERYRLEEPLGAGGMAFVYRAIHLGTEKECALKIIRPDLAKKGGFVDKFLTEARIAGRIGSHPYIVDVFDTGTDEDRGLPFIAMELVKGTTLKEYRIEHGAQPWQQVAEFVRQLGEALDEAHEAGIIHRDLKPGNVIVSTDRKGRKILKILDFGIAKVLDASTTGTATQVSTPLYGAPEQLGASVRKLAAQTGFTISAGVSAATDIWALGLISFELLTGESAEEYWGVPQLSELMFKVALEPHVAPTEVLGDRAELLPPGFDAWFLRCIAHNSAERWQSAQQAVTELSRLLDKPGQTEASTHDGPQPEGDDDLTKTTPQRHSPMSDVGTGADPADSAPQPWATPSAPGSVPDATDSAPQPWATPSAPGSVPQAADSSGPYGAIEAYGAAAQPTDSTPGVVNGAASGPLVTPITPGTPLLVEPQPRQGGRLLVILGAAAAAAIATAIVTITMRGTPQTTPGSNSPATSPPTTSADPTAVPATAEHHPSSAPSTNPTATSTETTPETAAPNTSAAGAPRATAKPTAPPRTKPPSTTTVKPTQKPPAKPTSTGKDFDDVFGKR